MYLNDRGLSILNIGIFITSAVIVATFLRIFVGNLADMVNRVILIRFILGFRALMLILMVLLIYINANLVYIFLATFFIALGFSMFLPVADSYVADISGNERIKGFSLIRVAINGGWAVGTFSGSLLLRYGYLPLFVGSTIIMFLAFLTSFRLYETERKTVRKFKLILPNYAFLGFSLTSVLVYTLSSQLTSNFSLFSVKFLGIDKSMVAYLFSLNGLLIILFQMPITKALKKLGYTLSIVVGGISFALGYAILLFANEYLHLIGSVVFITLGEMFIFPVIIASASNRAPDNELGAYMGFWSTFQGMGYSLGPAWGGFLLDNFQRGAWAVLSLQSLLAAFLFCINPEKTYRAEVCKCK